MQARLELNANSAAYRAMLQLEQYVRGSGINPTLLELIKIRASQINGCAFCIDMHTKDARLQGETEQRIYALNAWRETPFFTPEERAVLALTHSVMTFEIVDGYIQTIYSVRNPEKLKQLSASMTDGNGD